LTGSVRTTPLFTGPLVLKPAGEQANLSKTLTSVSLFFSGGVVGSDYSVELCGDRPQRLLQLFRSRMTANEHRQQPSQEAQAHAQIDVHFVASFRHVLLLAVHLDSSTARCPRSVR